MGSFNIYSYFYLSVLYNASLPIDFDFYWIDYFSIEYLFVSLCFFFIILSEIWPFIFFPPTCSLLSTNASRNEVSTIYTVLESINFVLWICCWTFMFFLKYKHKSGIKKKKDKFVCISFAYLQLNLLFLCLLLTLCQWSVNP